MEPITPQNTNITPQPQPPVEPVPQPAPPQANVAMPAPTVISPQLAQPTNDLGVQPQVLSPQASPTELASPVLVQPQQPAVVPDPMQPTPAIVSGQLGVPTPPSPVSPQPMQPQPDFQQAPINPVAPVQMPGQVQGLAAVMPQQQPMQAGFMNPQPPQQPAVGGITLPKRLREPSKKLSTIMACVFIAFSLGMVGFSYRVLTIRKKEAGKVSAIETPSKKVRDEIKKVGKDVQDRPDGTLDLSSTFDPYDGAHDQAITAKQGQQINSSTGLSFIVKGMSPWTPTDKYTKADSGKKFIRIDLLLGNRSTKRIDASAYVFNIKEGEGKPRDDATVYLYGDDKNSFAVDEFNLNDYKDGIDSQKSIKGILIMEVKDNTPLTLVYSENPYGQLPGEKDEDYPQSQEMKVKAEIPL